MLFSMALSGCGGAQILGLKKKERQDPPPPPPEPEECARLWAKTTYTRTWPRSLNAACPVTYEPAASFQTHIQGHLQVTFKSLFDNLLGAQVLTCVTLTALQKHFVDFFLEFAWEFCIEKWRGIFVKFFLVSVSHKMKHENSLKKIRGKFGAKFGAKFGTKNRKIRETFVLQLFWPKTCVLHVMMNAYRAATNDCCFYS